MFETGNVLLDLFLMFILILKLTKYPPWSKKAIFIGIGKLLYSLFIFWDIFNKNFKNLSLNHALEVMHYILACHISDKTKKIIESEKPNILVYGHSHILKVKYDKENKVLLINPGAAGRHGFHKKRTMVRFEINGNEIENMEVIELGNRSKSSNSIWGTNNF